MNALPGSFVYWLVARKDRMSVRYFQDKRRVAGRFEKTDEVVAADRRRGVIGQRMTIDDIVLHQFLIKHEGNISPCIVEGSEYGDRAGDDTEVLHQLFRSSEGDPAGSADDLVNRLQIDSRTLLDGQDKILVLLVLDEEVLRVTASRRLSDSATVKTGG